MSEKKTNTPKNDQVVEQAYFLPSYGVSVIASSCGEAIKKAKETQNERI